MRSPESPKSEIARLLKLKLEMRRRRPAFYRHQYWKFIKFKRDPKWRKPKGIDNKMRLKLKGYPPMVSVGYRGPAKVRSLHPTGLKPVVVSNKAELEKLDPAKHIVYLSSTLSVKKKVELRELAVSKGFKVAN